MSVTISDVVSVLDFRIGDTSTDSASANDRYDAITEATVWLIERTTNEHAVRTYSLNYVDTVHEYKISSAIADMLEPADLRRGEELQTMPATRKSSREMAEDIGNKSSEFAFTVEHKNGNTYAVINLDTDSKAIPIAGFDTLTSDGGTWTGTNDASNLVADTINLTNGSGSLSFDVSGATTQATVSSTVNSNDLTQYLDVGIFVMDIFIPDSTYTTSFTLYWGSDATNYWSVTSTVDAGGSTFADGWNKVAFQWQDATKTLTPDIENIDYIRLDLNYGASQTADTGYKVDYLRLARPEVITFYYLSQRVGVASGGSSIYKYTAASDIPYYSSQYDHYKFPVAHKAAAIILRSWGLKDDSILEETEAEKTLTQKQKLFGSVHVPEDRAFKVKHISFKRRKF